MSDGPVRIALVGATGLIGAKVIEACLGREDVRLTAISRSEFKLPQGARMELFIAQPDKWGDVFEAIRPKALICALGTKLRKADEDEEAFRALDRDLILATARAAKENGIERLVAFSSVGADPLGPNVYVRVKGEVERELKKMWLGRLDILRLDPLASAPNLSLKGMFRQFRGIRAETLADAALALAKRPARGRFVHDHDAILRAARSLPQIAPED
jgi:uncharacterized protein YbjT (DUF2867 family)